MSIISENIKFLRKHQGLTQQEFADQIDIKRSLVGAYEEGRADPRISNLINMSSLFNIRVDDLVDTEFSQMSADEFDKFIHNDQTSKFKVLAITVDDNNKENIEFIPQKAAAGYLSGYADPEFIKELPRFKLPFLPEHATHRAFEISGDSMLPIKSGTIVIGAFIDELEDIKNGKTYILVTAVEGVVFKRVFNYLDEKKNLFLVSDNRAYAPYEIKAEEVIEIWEAKAYISVDFTDPNMESSNLSINDLASMVMELKSEVSRLKSN